jgi:hypothetical protein
MYNIHMHVQNRFMNGNNCGFLVSENSSADVMIMNHNSQEFLMITMLTGKLDQCYAVEDIYT